MSFHQFLHFNRDCPSCGEPLDLYMQWHNSTLWKAHQPKPDTYTFHPYKMKKGEMSNDDSIIIVEKDNILDLYFSSQKIKDEAERQNMHFFFLCNENGFVEKGDPVYDYEINIYKACYFRSSVEMQMKKSSKKKILLSQTIPEQEKFTNQEESFAFISHHDELEKVYILSLKSVEDMTKLWHYTATREQKANENFEPKLFDKEMPLLTVRPKFDLENRERLIDRFDSWILIS